MSVEARIREMLLSSQKNLNEVASSGNDNTNPKQGNSKDASFDDLGDFDKQKPTVATGKDNSASSKAAIAGDSTNPKQGSSKDATWEDLDDTDLGKKASAKMSKDTSIKPAIKGDTRNEETESDEDDVLQDDQEDEDQIDEEALDELSKKTLGSYIRKASNHRVYLAKKDKDTERAQEDLGRVASASISNAARKAVHDASGKISDDRTKISNKDYNRQDGIRTAVKKLTKEEIESIFGTDLTEEFQTKATEIFEAAVIARVNDEVMAIEEELEEAYETAYTDALEESTKELVEKLDSYLDYVVDQWLEENKLAVEQGLKLEVMEGFMDGLKGLFQEHYIEVPDEKFDVLESMQAQIDELKGKLNEEIEKNIDNAKLVQEAKRLEVLEKASIGLADTEVERFEKLIEGIEFKDPDVYLEKLQIIRKNHFTKALEEGSILEAESGANIKVGDDRISRYAQAISRSVKK